MGGPPPTTASPAGWSVSREPSPARNIQGIRAATAVAHPVKPQGSEGRSLAAPKGASQFLRGRWHTRAGRKDALDTTSLSAGVCSCVRPQGPVSLPAVATKPGGDPEGGGRNGCGRRRSKLGPSASGGVASKRSAAAAGRGTAAVGVALDGEGISAGPAKRHGGRPAGDHPESQACSHRVVPLQGVVHWVGRFGVPGRCPALG